MTSEDLERRIRQFDWPAASPTLRARVLAVETSLAPAPVIWSDRIWFSRTFRWSVAAAVVAMMAIISRPDANAAQRQPAPSVVAEAEAARIAAIDAGLSDDAAAALARRTVTSRALSNSRAADLMTLVKIDGGF